MNVPITLPVNKWLASLTAVIAYMQNHYSMTGVETNALLRSTQDVNVANGNGKLVTSADIFHVTDYNETSTLLTVTKPIVKEQYLPVEHYKTIPASIQKYLLRQSFLSEDYSSEFAGYIRGMMEYTKDIYMYNDIVTKYETWTPTLPTQTITIDLISTTGKTGTELNAIKTHNTNTIYETILNLADNMGAPSRKYNDQEFMQMPSRSEFKITMNSKFKNDMLINTLATLLNSDKITGTANNVDKIITIPYDQFTVQDTKDNVIGWFEAGKKVQWGYFYEVATEFFDASNLTLNAFLHFAYYLGTVDAKPMVKLVANYVTV